jgi:hypothetical protein
VKVLCSEGIASHTGPESCVVHREVQGEALTGESVGQPLSRESFKLVQDADVVSVVEGNTDGHALAHRNWYKNLIYALGFYTGYAVKTLPWFGRLSNKSNG